MNDASTAHNCHSCPLNCGADRAKGPGACGVGGTEGIGDRDPYVTAFVARAARHYYEEPFISGVNGSGAIFFSGCNMKCVFCQNKDISSKITGKPVDPDELCNLMLRLQVRGAHNINLVTPTPHIELLVQAIPLARAAGLTVPIVYNTNAYEKVESLKRLDGMIDIYLPDMKYGGITAARKYSGTPNYFKVASKALLEMHRQCGKLVLDERGMAKRGVIVRHLVLPGSLDEARTVLDFIYENLPIDTQISLMSQYTPPPGMEPPLNRKLAKKEYNRIVEYALAIGLDNLLMQGLSSAVNSFTPEFDGFLE